MITASTTLWPLLDYEIPDARIARRLERDEAYERYGPAPETPQFQFVFWHIYEGSQLVAVVWRNNSTGEERRFEPWDFDGVREWKQACLRERAAA